MYRHDINDGLPIDGPFDLIHARLLLMHLSWRREIVSMLKSALAPRGVLVIGEFTGLLRLGASGGGGDAIHLLNRDYIVQIRHILTGGAGIPDDDLDHYLDLLLDPRFRAWFYEFVVSWGQARDAG